MKISRKIRSKISERKKTVQLNSNAQASTFSIKYYHKYIFLRLFLVTNVEHVGHGPDKEDKEEFMLFLLFGAFLTSAPLFAKTALKHL